MAPWKYLLIAAAFASWVVVELLADVSRYGDWPLLYIDAGLALTLVIIALWALVRRNLREFAIFMLVPCVTAFPGIGQYDLADWLQKTGFRLYASPVETYLSRCALFDFVDDDGSKQKVGQCPGIPQSFNSSLTIVYDTTGQLDLPEGRRTRAWKSTVQWHLSAGEFLAEEDHGDAYIWGNFYAVLVPLDKEDGNNVEYPPRLGH